MSGRPQRVVLDGTVSKLVNVTSGVPQGSILEPLLFNIVMNSISKLPLSRNANPILYAENVLLYKPVDTPDDIDELQQDLNSILNWMTSQRLTAN